jgi:uncharacterized protein (TIGR03067 family)
MSATTCPSHDQLFDYVVGKLSDEVSDGVAEHLESCESCQAGLATFDDADDTLVGQLRQPAQQDPYRGESQCQVAVARARSVAGRPVSTGGEPADSAATDSLLLGALGEYQLLEKLGRGGMGTVYRAIHTKLDRVVALKVLPKSRSDDEKAIARFEREMKAIGRLDHANIVGAYDAREIEGKPVLIMEYVEGLDLGKLVRRLGPLPVGDACELARQAALGLQYAHEHGLVHRDVKPSNLMLTPEGEVKVLDLGLARFHRVEGDSPIFAARKSGQSPETSDEMTGSGQAMGTADYMAPEQASDSHGVDIRADVYSLGCTLYKLLTGRAPFGGPDHKGTFEKMTAHVREPVPPIREFDPEIPEELAAVLDRMLAKEPDERYATPQQVADALEPFCIECDLAGLLVRAEQAEAAEPPGYPLGAALPRDGSSAAPQSQPTPLPFWRRGKLVAAAVGLMLLSVGAGIALGIIITITKDGQTTKIELPPDSEAKIGADGRVDVKLAGRTVKSATAAGETQAVFVALENIPFGATLTPQVLRLEQWPKDKVPSGAFSRIEEVEGRRTRTHLYAGEPILEIKLLGKSETYPAAAGFDFEAIQGTWEVVSSSQGQHGDDPLLAHGLVTWRESIPPPEVWRSSSVVITEDAIKVRGKHFRNVDLECQFDRNKTPKAIDLLGSHKGARGIYEFDGDRLKMCLAWTEVDKFGQSRRPDAFSEGLGATNELVALERVGDAEAVTKADQRAMQGTWEVVKAWAKMPRWPDAPRRKYAAPYGEIANGRKVVIKGSSLTIKGLPGQSVKSDGSKGDAAGGVGDMPDWLQPMGGDDVFEYELYLHQRIDFVGPVGFPCAGLYRLEGDRLSIRLGELRAREIDAPPAEGEVFLELKRVRGAPTGDSQAPAGIHQNDGIRVWPPDEPKPAATGPS